VSPRPTASSAWRGALLGLLAVGAIRALAGALEPERGEPLWLRWLRAAADHPVRTGAAVLLLHAAAVPRGRLAAPDAPEGPQEETEGPLPW
jgi:hypothetical protein